MALVGANYKFLYIDVGSCGKNSDGGIFQNCSLNEGIQNNSLNIPPPSCLQKAVDLGEFPYVIVADEAFPLDTNIMRPFPGKGITYEQRIFNYRLSRARRIVENAFRILCARWRVVHTKINLSPYFVTKIVKAACVLHNYLCNEIAVEEPVVDNETPLQQLQKRGYRSKKEASDARKKFATYFVQHDALSWQDNVVNRGKF